MKNELYFYAASLKCVEFKSGTYFLICFLLLVFMLPIFITTPFYGLILLATYILVFFLVQKDKEKRGILSLALFLLYLGLECSVLVTTIYRMTVLCFFMIGFLGIGYEILWLIQLKKKIYSKKQKASIYTGGYIVSFTLLGAALGKWMAAYCPTNFNIWILSILGAFFIIYAVSIFQKYLVSRILYK